MPQTRTRKPKTEYSKRLRKFRSSSERHVLVLEAAIKETEKRHIFRDADELRQCGNELTSIMRKRHEQLVRTKRYRKLKTLYGKYKNSGDEKELAGITQQMNEMQKAYRVTWDDCRTEMISIGKAHGVKSIFSLTRAEDVWSGVEKVLYADGKDIHFRRRGDLPDIRAKQPNRGIVLSVKDNRLWFKYNGISFTYTDRCADRFVKDELYNVLKYLEEPEVKDRHAVETLYKDGICISTYRPCYASLVCKTIRGKLRVYIHLTLEGRAVKKYNRDGSPRHTYGKGNIGCDIGTQTIAYTTDTEAGLKNLAERGNSIKHMERQERRLYRAMNRSRRAMNPDNYNEDGTVKKGPKTWKNSKRYIKLQKKHAEAARISAENRHLAINEDVNHLRSLGSVFITEPKNAKKLQKKAKTDTVNSKGRHNRRKRFGRSIKNRCPGYFQQQVKQKFESTGGVYIEVPADYRASQYDHTADDYRKKKLSERMYRLKDGTKVQRDWYSSFLLYCFDVTCSQIDKEKCRRCFALQHEMEVELINSIIRAGIKVMNSGIRLNKACNS